MEDVGLLRRLNEIINGNEWLPKSKHLKYGSFFSERGYTAIKPYSNNLMQRQCITDFLVSGDDFKIEPE
jgi:hypothetical protein